MTDRDHFAAAALTGWLASQQTVISQAEMAQRAYRYADAMLREKGQTNHDAAPAARVSARECTTPAGTGGTCPYVVGETTRYCSLTPFTLTDEEREAIEEAMRQVVESDCIATPHALEVIGTLRGLLERTR